MRDYSYYFSEFLTMDHDSKELKCYWNEASSFDRRDTRVEEGQSLTMYQEPSYQFNADTYHTTELGGPFYLEVGRNIAIDNYNML